VTICLNCASTNIFTYIPLSPSLALDRVLNIGFLFFAEIKFCQFDEASCQLRQRLLISLSCVGVGGRRYVFGDVYMMNL